MVRQLYSLCVLSTAVQFCSALLRNNYSWRRSVCVCVCVCVWVCGMTLWAETRLHLLSLFFFVDFNWKSRESNEGGGDPVRWIA